MRDENRDKHLGNRFAAIIPVGPSAIDVARAASLLTALARWEQNIGWCLIIEDLPQSSGLTEVTPPGSIGRLIRIQNPRQDEATVWSAGVNAGIFKSLAWLQANTDADFFLRIDTDALAIGPFASSIRTFIHHNPEAGIVGTIGLSCNPSVKPLQDLRREPALLRLRRMLPESLTQTNAGRDSWIPIDPVRRVQITDSVVEAFKAVRPHIEAAVRNGYASSIYCQGGVCAVTRKMVDRMAAAGYLDRPEVWLKIPVNDDMVLAMYARAVGMSLHDLSEPGQPFASQYRALPYPLEELVARGHSLIHSVRGDGRYTEFEIREFFRHRVTQVQTAV